MCNFLNTTSNRAKVSSNFKIQIKCTSSLKQNGSYLVLMVNILLSSLSNKVSRSPRAQPNLFVGYVACPSLHTNQLSRKKFYQGVP